MPLRQKTQNGRVLSDHLQYTWAECHLFFIELSEATRHSHLCLGYLQNYDLTVPGALLLPALQWFWNTCDSPASLLFMEFSSCICLRTVEYSFCSWVVCRNINGNVDKPVGRIVATVQGTQNVLGLCLAIWKASLTKFCLDYEVSIQLKWGEQELDCKREWGYEQ